MSEWVEAAEKALTAVKSGLKIPYDFERFRAQENQLPDTYIVYFQVSASPGLFADNKERAYQSRIQVSLYYRNIRTFLTIPEQIISAFTAAGFCRVGEGRIPFQINTGHYGWRCDFNYYETR